MYWKKKAKVAVGLIAVIVVLFEVFPVHRARIYSAIYSGVGTGAFYFQGPKLYAQNQRFILNNNLAQYSTYVIANENNSSETTYRVEGFVHYRYKYVSEQSFGGKENFTCVVRLTNIEHFDLKEETVVLAATEAFKYYWRPNRKFVCHLDPNIFESVSHDARNFNVDNLVVAVIWKHDFDEALDEVGFYDKLENMTYTQPMVLPFSLINFQKAVFIRSVEPRLPAVAFCVHYAYGISPLLLNWIDMHLEFGVREIMLYDGMEKKDLTKLLGSRYGTDRRITVVDFDIARESLCHDSFLFQQCTEKTCPEKVKSFLRESCFDFHHIEFRERFHWRNRYEQLSSNDCFTILSQKYQFIGYYDLDEFVFPRTMDSLKDFFEPRSMYTCNSSSPVCSLEPLQAKNNKSVASTNYLYNYLMSLVEENRGARDISNLASIHFAHTLMLVPNEVEKALMYNISQIIASVDSKEANRSAMFPFNLYLSDPPYESGHTFVIQAEDVDYIKYLHGAYSSIAPCAFQGHLKGIQNLNSDLVRYMYYLTEPNERMGKSIHYYKNVRSLFIHYAVERTPGSWGFTASGFNGHTSPHFRNDTAAVYKRNHKSSIRKLFIDFEYLFYLLKNHTSFCGKV